MSDSTSEDPKPDDGAQQSAPSGGTAVAPSSPAVGGVNAQILDAVNQTTSIVMDSAVNQGTATAYQKVAQATSFAIQDATDYSRNIENIAMTAQGIIIAKMIEDESTIPVYSLVLVTLQEMVAAASTNLAAVGTSATAVTNGFPSKA